MHALAVDRRGKMNFKTLDETFRPALSVQPGFFNCENSVPLVLVPTTNILCFLITLAKECVLFTP